MSEEPVAERAREDLAEGDLGAWAKAAAPSTGGRFAMRAIIVAALSFSVVVAVVIAIHVMSGRGPAFDNVRLLENGRFTMTLPPMGDRSVMFEYTIAVKVISSRGEMLDELIDPEQRNMMPRIQESIRQIIRKEDYLKLREEKLDDVKRHIKQSLNAMMNGKKVVEEVIFEKWDVIP